MGKWSLLPRFPAALLFSTRKIIYISLLPTREASATPKKLCAGPV